MSEFAAYNPATHPIVKLTEDWNNLLDHGLDGPYDYLIRVNGIYIEAIRGNGAGAGTIIYGGAANVGSVPGTNASSVIQAVLDTLNTDKSDIGGRIIGIGDITVDTTIKINTWDNLEFEWYGTISCTASTLLLIGDSTNLVRRCRFKFNRLNGINNTPNGIHVFNGLWNMIDVLDIRKFNIGILGCPEVDVVGACADNLFNIGQIGECTTGIKLISYNSINAISQGNHFVFGYIAGCVRGIWTTGDLTELNIFQGESHNIIGGVDQIDVQSDGNYGSNLYITGYINTTAGVGIPQETIIGASLGGETRINIGRGKIKIGDANFFGGLGFITPNLAHRGDLIYEAGAAGVADAVYTCLKDDIGNYAWHRLNNSASHWFDALANVVADIGRNASLGFTNIDLTGTVSSDANMVFLQVVLVPTVVGGAGNVQLQVRKDGTSPARNPTFLIDSASIPNEYYYSTLIVGLNASKIFEYSITVSAGWTVNTYIDILGYF